MAQHGRILSSRGSSEVEQWTENPRVAGSIPALGTRIPWLNEDAERSGSSSAVERLLAKEEAAGSNPVFRSRLVN